MFSQWLSYSRAIVLPSLIPSRFRASFPRFRPLCLECQLLFALCLKPLVYQAIR